MEKGIGLICDGTGEGLVTAECSLAWPDQATEMDVGTQQHLMENMQANMAVASASEWQSLHLFFLLTIPQRDALCLVMHQPSWAPGAAAHPSPPLLCHSASAFAKKKHWQDPKSL